MTPVRAGPRRGNRHPPGRNRFRPLALDWGIGRKGTARPAGTERAAQAALAAVLAIVDPARSEDWARRLVAQFGASAAALAAPPAQWLPILGERRAVALLAACRELLLQILREPAVERPMLATRHDLHRYLHHRMAFEREETLRAFFLDARSRLIGEEEIARGGPDGIAVEPRQVLVRALALGASGLILVHNHPSGNPRPSAADRRFTQRLAIAADCLGIRLREHLVVARGGIAAIDPPPLPSA